MDKLTSTVMAITKEIFKQSEKRDDVSFSMHYTPEVNSVSVYKGQDSKHIFLDEDFGDTLEDTLNWLRMSE